MRIATFAPDEDADRCEQPENPFQRAGVGSAGLGQRLHRHGALADLVGDAELGGDLQGS